MDDTLGAQVWCEFAWETCPDPKFLVRKQALVRERLKTVRRRLEDLTGETILDKVSSTPTSGFRVQEILQLRRTEARLESWLEPPSLSEQTDYVLCLLLSLPIEYQWQVADQLSESMGRIPPFVRGVTQALDSRLQFRATPKEKKSLEELAMARSMTLTQLIHATLASFDFNLQAFSKMRNIGDHSKLTEKIMVRSSRALARDVRVAAKVNEVGVSDVIRGVISPLLRDPEITTKVTIR
jgi:hypothetical protein